MAGAMKELRLGDPVSVSTDVGPVIDAEAHEFLQRYPEQAGGRFGVLWRRRNIGYRVCSQKAQLAAVWMPDPVRVTASSAAVAARSSAR